jgi:hypothetical protein
MRSAAGWASIGDGRVGECVWRFLVAMRRGSRGVPNLFLLDPASLVLQTNFFGQVSIQFSWETHVSFSQLTSATENERCTTDTTDTMNKLCTSDLKNSMQLWIKLDPHIKSRLLRKYPNICQRELSVPGLIALFNSVLKHAGSPADTKTVDGNIDPLNSDPLSSSDGIRVLFPARVFFERRFARAAVPAEHFREVLTLHDYYGKNVPPHETSELFKTEMIPWAMQLAQAFLQEALRFKEDGVVPIVGIPDRTDLVRMYHTEQEKQNEEDGHGEWPLTLHTQHRGFAKDFLMIFGLTSMSVSAVIEVR